MFMKYSKSFHLCIFKSDTNFISMVKLTISLLLFLFSLILSGAILFDPVLLLKNDDQYSKLSTNQTWMDFVRQEGYPAEVYTVQTTDGYLLTVHRIPYSPKSPPSLIRKPAVYLQHGLFSNSIYFVCTGTIDGLAFILADAGFDVFLGNIRGSRHSRRHIRYNPDVDKKQFWNFSFHEMGYYDATAIIDFILAQTGNTNVTYVGVSLGTTIFFAMASSRPEYNSKVNMFFGLGPTVYIQGSTMYTLLSIFRHVDVLLEPLDIYEVFPRGRYFGAINTTFCANYQLIGILCNILNKLIDMTRSRSVNDNNTAINIAAEHMSGGSSIKNVAHLAQLTISGREFRQYANPPSLSNLYGLLQLPAYPLNKVSTKVVLLYGQNDTITPFSSLTRLKNNLPNAVMEMVPGFNHEDFIFSKNLRSLNLNILAKLRAQLGL